MIEPKEFYEDKNLIDNKKKKMLWSNVNSSIKTVQTFRFRKIDLKSYSLGFVTALIFLFAAFGFYTFINNFSQINKPQIVHLNDAYRNTIASIEKFMPDKYKEYESVAVDDYISPRKGKLVTINEAIGYLKSDTRNNDYSKIKLERLNSLYKMKLELLEEIIEMEEQL